MGERGVGGGGESGIPCNVYSLSTEIKEENCSVLGMYILSKEKTRKLSNPGTVQSI